MTLSIIFIWHFVSFPNELEWELCRQEEKKGLEINSDLPFLDSLEGTQLKNL